MRNFDEANHKAWSHTGNQNSLVGLNYNSFTTFFFSCLHPAPEILNYEPITTATDLWWVHRRLWASFERTRGETTQIYTVYHIKHNDSSTCFSCVFHPSLRSVGVIAYMLVTGESPFAGDNKQETYMNVSQVNVDYSRDTFSRVSELAVDFIRKLLVKAPEWVQAGWKDFFKPESQWNVSTFSCKQKHVLSMWKLERHVMFYCRRVPLGCEAFMQVRQQAWTHSTVSEANMILSTRISWGFLLCCHYQVNHLCSSDVIFLPHLTWLWSLLTGCSFVSCCALTAGTGPALQSAWATPGCGSSRSSAWAPTPPPPVLARGAAAPSGRPRLKIQKTRRTSWNPRTLKRKSFALTRKRTLLEMVTFEKAKWE